MTQNIGFFAIVQKYPSSSSLSSDRSRNIPPCNYYIKWIMTSWVDSIYTLFQRSYEDIYI